MASKLFAFLLSLSAAFISYNLYNPPKSAIITMTGPEMNVFEAPGIVKYVERIQAAATPERPALASDRGRWAMAWLHLVVWNSWKSAYFYADKFPEGDFQHYSEYALLTATFLVDHHEAEEAALFPVLEKKIAGSMQQNEAQHQAFLKPLEELIEYLRSAQISAVKFDAATYRSKVDAILENLMEHLSDELDSLEGSKLLAHFSESDLDAINKGVHKAQQGDSHKMLPFILQVCVGYIEKHSSASLTKVNIRISRLVVPSHRHQVL
ncbi:hypothetical protein D9757_003175 [Collybiopsis confluens]|uniref:Hemerythrin-like domain-containing protein n=1 Tax=Collybiopsis confluens TaxID=2823264 RepID=A0A8H5MEK6_9AGAR|nr:hypothetical protein D9757_003175 [Collybiopsis confluens]